MKPAYFSCILIFALFFFCITSCSNNTDDTENNDSTVIANSAAEATTFDLPIPNGWTTETILFPIDFAPAIEYKGVETLRFTKGWGDVFSEEHWSYAFLWWLDGAPAINDTTLQKDLTNYYSGLVKRNLPKITIPADKVAQTVTKINTLQTMPGDIATYNGTINMLNYLAQKPITLNVSIHVKDCKVKDKTAILFEVSPQKETHAIWQTFNKLNTDIRFK